MTRHAWCNGTPVTAIDVWSRGLHYGDGFFTTIRLHTGRLLNWRAHHQRLKDSAARMGFPSDCVDALEVDLRGLLPQFAQRSGVIKLMLFRGRMAARGYKPAATEPITRAIFFNDAPSDVSDAPLTVGVSPVLWPTPDVYPGIKHLNRLVQVEASRRLPQGQEEALLCNSRHEVISGIASALVAKLGRTLYFPVLHDAGVQSTTALALQGCAEKAGYRVQTVPLPPMRLAQMEGLALLNAVRGLRPVCKIEGAFSHQYDVSCWAPLQTLLKAQLEADSWGGEAP